MSKASASRSRSVDLTAQAAAPNKLRRPGSRDRPPVAGVFDEIQQRPSSSHRLETIGEPETEEAASKSLKKKRRSSLSDLKSLMAQATLEDHTPLMPLNADKQTAEKFNSSPRVHHPSKIPVSPQSYSQSIRSPRQKENSNDPFSPKPLSSEAPKPFERGHSKTLSTSQIPTLKPVRRASNAESPPGPLPAQARVLALPRNSACSRHRSCANAFRSRRRRLMKWMHL